MIKRMLALYGLPSFSCTLSNSIPKTTLRSQCISSTCSEALTCLRIADKVRVTKFAPRTLGGPRLSLLLGKQVFWEGSSTMHLLTRHTYWLWGPGEKVLERMMVLPRRKGPGDGAPTRRSLGRTTVGDGAGVSVLVSLST